MHCHNRHVLVCGISNPTGEKQDRYCDICLRNMPDVPSQRAVRSCTKCDIDVCEPCISKVKVNMDTGILIQLARQKTFMDGKMTLLDVYKSQPHFSDELYRNPDAAAIYWEVQRFNFSDKYRLLLERDLDSAQEQLMIARSKVAIAENSLLEFKCQSPAYQWRDVKAYQCNDDNNMDTDDKTVLESVSESVSESGLKKRGIDKVEGCSYVLGSPIRQKIV